MSVQALNLLDPTSLLPSSGSVGVLLVLFAETGLLIGFLLPGDSGLHWTLRVVLGGYGLGSSIANVDRNLLPLVALIVSVSLIPAIVELRRSRQAGAQG